MVDPLLWVDDLRLETSAGQPLVAGLSLQIQAGQAVGLLGASGSGKSLTSLAIFGLLPPGVQQTGGRILFDGTNLSACSDAELRPYRGGRLGLVFQDPASSFNPVVPLGRQVGEALEVHCPGPVGERCQEVLRLLAEVGLEEPERVAAAYPHQLSGGMLQRAMIAAALAGQPELLIADEPTTALDVRVQAGILNMVHSLRQERGLAMLWITHDLAVAARVCDRLAVLDQGRIVEEGPVTQLLSQPEHATTRELVAASPARQEERA